MLHLWQLLKPAPPDDLYPPDNTPTEIANGRLEAIRMNAAADHDDARNKMLANARDEARKNKKVAVHLAADRIALYKTLQFIESRWREGANAEQTLKDAQDFRSQEYDKVMRDSVVQYKIKDGIATLPENNDKVKNLLVDSLPVGKGASSRPSYRSSYRPSGPKKR